MTMPMEELRQPPHTRHEALRHHTPLSSQLRNDARHNTDHTAQPMPPSHTVVSHSPSRIPNDGVAGVAGLLVLTALCADAAQSIAKATHFMHSELQALYRPHSRNETEQPKLTVSDAHVMAEATGSLHNLLACAAHTLPDEVMQHVQHNMLELLTRAAHHTHAANIIIPETFSQAGEHSQQQNKQPTPVFMPGVLSYTLLHASQTLVEDYTLHPLRHMSDALLPLYLRSLKDFRALAHAIMTCIHSATMQLVHVSITPCNDFSFKSSAHAPETEQSRDIAHTMRDACTRQGARLCARLKQLHDAVLQPMSQSFEPSRTRPRMAQHVHQAMAQPYVSMLRRAIDYIEEKQAETHSTGQQNTNTLSTQKAILCTAAYRMLRLVECMAQAEWSQAHGTVSTTARQQRYRQLLRESNGRVTQTVLRAIAEDRQLLLEPLATRGPAGHRILKLHHIGQEGAQKTMYLYLDKGIIFYKMGRQSVFTPARSVEELFSNMDAG